MDWINARQALGSEPFLIVVGFVLSVGVHYLRIDSENGARAAQLKLSHGFLDGQW